MTASRADVSADDGDRSRLLLWPGLAADERLFEPLRAHGVDFIVPPMIEPRRGESLRDYAARYANTLHARLPSDGRYALGGFSFGGQLATELAAMLDPRPAGLVLVAGVRGTHQISGAFKRQQRLGSAVPPVIARRLYAPFARRFARRDRLDHASTRSLVAMARDIDPAFLNWTSAACAGWPGPPTTLDVPIRHIHGELDRIIPDALGEADETVKGARHLITLTHPAEVARFVQRSLHEFFAPARPG